MNIRHPLNEIPSYFYCIDNQVLENRSKPKQISHNNYDNEVSTS